MPPVFGSYSVENNALTFHPRFALTGGVTYRAVFHLAGNGSRVEATFSQPGPTSPAEPHTGGRPSILPPTFCPTISSKLYVYFSAPMQSGGVWPKIHLIDEDGKTGGIALRRTGTGTVGPEQKRLTSCSIPAGSSAE